MRIVEKNGAGGKERCAISKRKIRHVLPRANRVVKRTPTRHAKPGVRPARRAEILAQVFAIFATIMAIADTLHRCAKSRKPSRTIQVKDAGTHRRTSWLGEKVRAAASPLGPGH